MTKKAPQPPEREASAPDAAPIARLFPDFILAEAVTAQVGASSPEDPVTQRELDLIEECSPLDFCPHADFERIVDATGISLLRNLRHLDLIRTGIRRLPPSLGDMKELRTLHLGDTPLTRLPALARLLLSLPLKGGRTMKRIALLVLILTLGARAALAETFASLFPDENLAAAVADAAGASSARDEAAPGLLDGVLALGPFDGRGEIADLTGLSNLTNLTFLDLGGTSLCALPEEIGRLPNLRELRISGAQITSLPESFGGLARLETLWIEDTPLAALPESFGRLASLSTLHLDGTQLKRLPDSFCSLTSLQGLDIVNTPLAALPESFGSLESLSFLDLSGTQLTALPESAGRLSLLIDLNLSGAPVTALPESMGDLQNLWALDLSGTRIASLPKSLGGMTNLTRLDLRGAPVRSLPESLSALEHLEIIQ